MILKIAVEKVKYHFDEIYSYTVSTELYEKAKVGCRVLVPFGKGDALRQGVILKTENIIENENELKKIHLILDKVPLISEKMLKLAFYLKNRYFCSFFDAFKCLLPAKINTSPEIFYSFKSNIKNINLSLKEKNFYKKLVELKSEMVVHSKIERLTEPSIVSKFLEKDILKIENFMSKNSVGREFESVILNENIEVKKLTLAQKNVYEFISNAKISPIKEVCYFTGESIRTVQSLVKRNILKVFKNETNFNNITSPEILKKPKNITLSEEQEAVFGAILKNYKQDKFSIDLLFGVTGSGKTHIILKLVDYVISIGKEVIFMVPEIALTSQFVSIFRTRYGESVAIFHSALSDKERFCEWERMKSGEAKIAVGTRSAVFAPFENLGLVVMDEEHENTYKSEKNPRFHAKNVSTFRCKIDECMLLLSSANPSIETYHKVKNIYTLKNRYGESKLPEVKIIDMNLELKNDIFSEELLSEIKINKENNKQTILLLNRRGFSPLVRCRKCGKISTCPNCNIALNYHKANNFLMCHYCGITTKFKNKCQKCSSEKTGFFGFGIQKVEEELKKLISEIKILRMDSDTAYSKKSYGAMLSDFKNIKYDVLLGTQMIAKGLDFPDVTLVGVISVDQLLYSSDFRNFEHAFSLITQAIGRSGRKNSKGKAIIQTFSPENEVINLAKNQDYKKFFEDEIELRKALLYPPFSDLCSINFAGENEFKTNQQCEQFFINLKDYMSKNYQNLPLKIFSGVPCYPPKASGKFRYKIVLKCRNNSIFRRALSEFIKEFCKFKGRYDVSIWINFDE